MSELTASPERADWVELYDQHARDLHRYLALRVDAQIADDLVSEAFLIAWERRDTFDESRASRKAWLFGIATNLLRQHVRSESRRLRAFARDHGRRAVGDVVEDRTAAALDAKSLVADLSEALADLRPEERDVLLMVAWADLSPAEVAEVTGAGVGTVRTRLHRARSKLRGLINAVGG